MRLEPDANLSCFLQKHSARVAVACTHDKPVAVKLALLDARLPRHGDALADKGEARVTPHILHAPLPNHLHAPFIATGVVGLATEPLGVGVQVGRCVGETEHAAQPARGRHAAQTNPKMSVAKDTYSHVLLFLILEAEHMPAPSAAHVLGLLESARLLPRGVAPARRRHPRTLAGLVALQRGSTAVPKVRAGKEVPDAAQRRPHLCILAVARPPRRSVGSRRPALAHRPRQSPLPGLARPAVCPGRAVGAPGPSEPIAPWRADDGHSGHTLGPHLMETIW